MGDSFDSIGEKERYIVLRDMQKNGLITDLKRQVKFKLMEKTHYIADFTYYENGAYVIEDFKGFKTQVYKIKRKIMIQNIMKSGNIFRESTKKGVSDHVVK